MPARSSLLDRILRDHHDRERGDGTALGPRERRAVMFTLLAGAIVVMLGDFNWTLSVAVAGFSILLIVKTGIDRAREPQGLGD